MAKCAGTGPWVFVLCANLAFLLESSYFSDVVANENCVTLPGFFLVEKRASKEESITNIYMQNMKKYIWTSLWYKVTQSWCENHMDTWAWYIYLP